MSDVQRVRWALLLFGCAVIRTARQPPKATRWLAASPRWAFARTALQLGVRWCMLAIPMYATDPPEYARRRSLGEVPEDAQQYAVKMSDGIRLATDVYLPDSPCRRFPVLLARLPYDKAGDECFMPDVARWFRARGYAVVVQDTRGKVRSDGEFRPFVSEAKDGYDTLEWLSAQPWCGGRVGMFGDSYYGFTQWAAAASGHRCLAAITPRATTADFGHAFAVGGVFQAGWTATWALETLIDDALYDGAPDWRVRPLADAVPAVLGGRRPFGLDQWAVGDLGNAPAAIPNPSLPTLHLGGWWDVIARSQLATWRAASNAPRHFLIMAATDHGWMPLRDPDTQARMPQDSAAAMRGFLDRYLAPLLPFFDAHVRDVGRFSVPRVRWELSWGETRSSVSWPPPESREMILHATHADADFNDSEGGGLGKAAESHSKVVRWDYDPESPVPSLDHPYYPLAEPADESAVERRPDVLTFTSDALRTPLDIAGPIVVRMSIRASSTSAHAVAKLVDVYPDGRALRIADGAARVDGRWPALSTVHLGDTGYRVRRGHRLRLELGTSGFPKYVLHPGTEEEPWFATRFRTVEMGVDVGGRDGLRVSLSVLRHGSHVKETS